jgi:ribonuclease VapC
MAAIMRQERDAGSYVDAIEAADEIFIAAPTWVESGIVITARRGEEAMLELEDLAADAGLEIVPCSAEHARLTIAAFRHFGEGRRRAGLNHGDCFSYALAVASDDSLLFKGDDFVQTDVKSALPTR